MFIKNIFLSLTSVSLLAGATVFAMDKLPETSPLEQKDQLLAPQLQQKEESSNVVSTPTTAAQSLANSSISTTSDKLLSTIDEEDFTLGANSDNNSSDDSVTNSDEKEESDTSTSSAKTNDQKLSDLDEAVSNQSSSSFQSSDNKNQYENWYFAKFDCFVSLKKGELERIHAAIAALFTPQNHQLAKQLRIWINMENRVAKLQNPYDFLPSIPSALKQYCLEKNLCDEKFNLFPVTKYMMLSIIPDAKDIEPKPQQLGSPRTAPTSSSSSTVDTKNQQISKAADMPATLDMLKSRQLIQSESDGKKNQLIESSESNKEKPRWQFTDRALKAVTYLHVDENLIKATYQKLTDLNDLERVSLGLLVHRQNPTSVKLHCKALYKKGLVKKNGSYAAPVEIQQLLKGLNAVKTTTLQAQRTTTHATKPIIKATTAQRTQLNKLTPQEHQCLNRIAQALPLKTVDSKTHQSIDYTPHTQRLESKKLIQRKYTVPFLVKYLYETGISLKTQNFVPLEELFNTGYIKLCSKGPDSDDKK